MTFRDREILPSDGAKALKRFCKSLVSLFNLFHLLRYLRIDHFPPWKKDRRKLGQFYQASQHVRIRKIFTATRVTTVLLGAQLHLCAILSFFIYVQLVRNVRYFFRMGRVYLEYVASLSSYHSLLGGS